MSSQQGLQAWIDINPSDNSWNSNQIPVWNISSAKHLACAGEGPGRMKRSTTPLSETHCVFVPLLLFSTSISISAAFNLQYEDILHDVYNYMTRQFALEDPFSTHAMFTHCCQQGLLHSWLYTFLSENKFNVLLCSSALMRLSFPSLKTWKAFLGMKHFRATPMKECYAVCALESLEESQIPK